MVGRDRRARRPIASILSRLEWLLRPRAGGPAVRPYLLNLMVERTPQDSPDYFFPDYAD